MKLSNIIYKLFELILTYLLRFYDFCYSYKYNSNIFMLL